MEEITGKKELTRWQAFRQRMATPYRLVVMNEGTFEEVRSFKLSLQNVYVALSSIVVLVAISVILLVAYTPLKRYLPGFGNMVQREELTAMSQEVDRLAEELQAQIAYTENFRNLLLGENYRGLLEAEAEMDSVEIAAEEPLEEVTLSAEEIQLRREMELEAIGEAARSQAGRPIAGSRNIPLEQLFFTAPVKGEISGAFEPDKKHNGIDVLAPKGTAVKAAMDGYVILSDYSYDTGYTLGIQHQHGVITFYKHNTELLKEVGAFVKAGEAVAIIGNTGHQSTGPHLHFELWHHGTPVDPAGYIVF
jgi:murein DD-endopeptidase MepM/ murein hydrolase activator NlpD